MTRVHCPGRGGARPDRAALRCRQGEPHHRPPGRELDGEAEVGGVRHRRRAFPKRRRRAHPWLAHPVDKEGACIIYWQAREISRIAAAPDFPFDRELLRHVSPVEWKNVILYGEIKIDPDKLRTRDR